MVETVLVFQHVYQDGIIVLSVHLTSYQTSFLNFIYLGLFNQLVVMLFKKPMQLD